jgi:hypothetical protein
MHEQVVHGFDVLGKEAHGWIPLEIFGTNGVPLEMETRDCSIADVSLTGDGKSCSSQNRGVRGGTSGVSAYMEHIESRFPRDMNAV